MPLKLQLGVSKKHGLPAFGSVGASCQLEIEMDSTLLETDAQLFHAYVQRIYARCARAVEDELIRHADNQGRQLSNVRVTASDGLNGAAAHRNMTSRGASQPSVKHITARQRDYACDLAERILGLAAGELDDLVMEQFSKPLGELTTPEGSQLISILQAMHARNQSVNAGDNGAADPPDEHSLQ